jgi:hypothetical protein
MIARFCPSKSTGSTVPGPVVSLGAMLNESGEALSEPAATLALFVAEARRRRPRAWQHVERLKRACEASLDAEAELRALRLRVAWLEAESQALRAEVGLLRPGRAAMDGTLLGHGPAVPLSALLSGSG